MAKGKTRNPRHEAAVGFSPGLYPLLSTIHRAVSVDVPKGRRAAPKGAGFDIAKWMGLLVQYGPMIAGLIASFQKPKPEPAPAPAPSPAPGPSPTPEPAPAPAPSPSSRRIVRGRSKILGVEGWKGKPHSHYSLGGGAVQNIKRGSEYCGAGYRIHMDSTPFSADGVAFQNIDLQRQPELFGQHPEQLFQTKWGAWSMGEGNNRINHYVTVDGVRYGPMGDMVPGTAWQEQEVVDLTSEYDDAALTVVLVVPQDIELSVEHTVQYQAGYVGPDGNEILFDPSETFKVKAWGF